jgi:uroporphyrinogen-III synthase
VVYEAVAAKTFSPATISLLKNKKIDVVTFYSARSAEIFHDLLRAAHCEAAVKYMQAVCLSDSIADSCKDYPWVRIHVAERPTQKHILECLANSSH